MDITASRDGQTGILALSGALDTMSAPALPAQVIAFCDDAGAGIGALLLDLSGLAYMTSAGFRALLLVKRRTESSAIGLALCGLTAVVAELFAVSAFDSIFRIYPDRAVALREITAADATC